MNWKRGPSNPRQPAILDQVKHSVIEPLHMNFIQYLGVGKSLFGQCVKVLYDGKEYLGFICGRDPQTEEWITRFEDVTEGKVTDPVTDKDNTLL